MKNDSLAAVFLRLATSLKIYFFHRTPSGFVIDCLWIQTCCLSLSRILKLASHCILYYLWSADLTKKLSSFACINIYLFSIFFLIDFANEKVWGCNILLNSWFINFKSWSAFFTLIASVAVKIQRTKLIYFHIYTL